VEVEIQPEPTPEVRAAIEEAFARAGLVPDSRGPGAWWQVGVEEALSADPRRTDRDV